MAEANTALLLGTPKAGGVGETRRAGEVIVAQFVVRIRPQTNVRGGDRVPGQLESVVIINSGRGSNRKSND